MKILIRLTFLIVLVLFQALRLFFQLQPLDQRSIHPSRPFRIFLEFPK